ncbi:MAG TPA: hypothetical protein VK980_05910 [Sphingomonas sp.]|nr:hypothetical protein [Sphingomonas sp.]
MTSTAQDRLMEVYQSYSDAYERRSDDLAAAQSPDQIKAILANVNTLEIAYLEAARNALDATGPAIEQAFTDAQTARAAVDAAYQNAKGIVEKIRLVGSLAKKATALVKAAHGG